jgi:hypothetical protein
VLSEDPALLDIRGVAMEHIQSEFDRGQRDSATDQLAGHAKLFWQTRRSWDDKLVEMMKDRFGVEVEHVSDITSSEKKSYEDGYNAATKCFIDKRFGVDAFQSAIKEIEAFRIESHRQYLERTASRKNCP